MPADTGGGRLSRRFRAVLFDWRGTLVHDPDPAWWITTALRSLGRPVIDAEVSSLVDRLRETQQWPEHLDAERAIDTSASLHRQASLRLFADAGLDAALAEAVYLLDFDPASHPLYPDTVDVLTSLRARSVEIAVVSDIHFDLRAEFAAQGLTGLVDTFVLSYEHGVQKPDPLMFELALEALGVEATDALMVGDRLSHDGGATALGIATLILPMPPRPELSRIAVVADLVTPP